MNTNRLSIKETILYAANAVVSHPWYFIKIFLLWMGLSYGLGLLGLLFGIPIVFGVNTAPVSFFVYFLLTLNLVFALMVFLLSCCAAVVWLVPIKLVLQWYDSGKEKITLANVLALFNPLLIFRLLMSSFIFSLLTAIGLLLCIVPGIYLMVKLQFVFYYLIDRKMGVIQAFKQSFADTTGNFWQLLGINIIASLFSYLFITVPVAYVMLVYAYRHISSRD